MTRRILNTADDETQTDSEEQSFTSRSTQQSHFRDEFFQAITCAGIDERKQQKSCNWPGKKLNNNNKLPTYIYAHKHNIN